jgi:hypothetical protein
MGFTPRIARYIAMHHLFGKLTTGAPGHHQMKLKGANPLISRGWGPFGNGTLAHCRSVAALRKTHPFSSYNHLLEKNLLMFFLFPGRVVEKDECFYGLGRGWIGPISFGFRGFPVETKRSIDAMAVSLDTHVAIFSRNAMRILKLDW